MSWKDLIQWCVTVCTIAGTLLGLVTLASSCERERSESSFAERREAQRLDAKRAEECTRAGGSYIQGSCFRCVNDQAN